MDRIRNKTVGTKMVMEDMFEETKEQQLRWYGLGRPVNTLTDGIRDSMQIGNVKKE
jgi:hypothetical protein